jgi:hypothetical protein
MQIRRRRRDTRFKAADGVSPNTLRNPAAKHPNLQKP